MANKTRHLKVARFVSTVLIVTILSFTNVPYQLLSNGLEAYIGVSNVVDKMWGSARNGNVVDNFIGTREAIERLKIQDAMAAANGDGVLLYGKSVNNGIWARTFTAPSTLNAEVNIASSITDIVRYIKQESSPTREETIAVVQTAISTTGSGIFALRNSAGTWTIDWCVRTGGGTFGGATCTNATYVSNANTIKRAFDITYENTSGDAMVVYSSGASATNEMKYRTWNGTTWSGETNLDTARLTGVVDWIELEAKRTAGANEITALFSDTNEDLSALVWDGTSVWGTEPSAALETALETIGTGTDLTVKSFDGAYETSSGDYIAAWGFNTIADVKHVTRPSAGAWSSVTTNTAFPEIGTVVDMAADPASTSNYVLHVSQDPAAADDQCVVWSGTAWPATPANCDTGSGAALAGYQNQGAAFLTNTVKRALKVYGDIAGTTLTWYTSDPAGNTWTLGTAFTITGAASAVTSPIEVVMDPFNAGIAMATVQKGTGIHMLNASMDTSGVVTWSNPLNAAVATSPTTGLYQPFSFAYYRFIAPPPTTLTISVSAGAKVANVDSGATSAFVHDIACTTDGTCAAFKMAAAGGGTATVTSIKITETGTVTANTELTNPTIIYDTDANYFNGTAGTFGTIASWAADQTATITGSVGIASGLTYYFYVRTDFLNGTARPDGGLNIDYQIFASTDVVSDGTESCSASCPLNLVDTGGVNTVFRPNVTSYTNSTEGALTDGGRTGQTVSIAGHGFGTTCNGTTAKAEIGTYILSCTGATFTDTTITIAVDSGVNVYGGTTTNGLLVTIGSTADDARSTFYIYPDITSTTPTPATGAKEGDSVTLTGTKFRALQGTGLVEFINCATGAVSATVSTWGDTSVAITVPAGIDDNDDACDIRVTRDIDAKTDVTNNTANNLGTYVILPKIVSLAVCTGCNADSGRTYLAGDTDGVVQLNGNHFGTAQGVNGKVEFTGGLGTATPGATIHGVVEGACGVAGWAAAGTSVCIEVTPAAIVSTVYTGSITITRNDLTTFAFSAFRVLPRITSNTPTADIVGNVIQIDGNHFCQSGTCPLTPPTAGDTVVFGTTPTISTDFVTTPNCTGASKWSHGQICVKVPAGTPTGSQPTKVTSNTLYVSNTKAFTVQSTVPLDPTNLRQFKNDGTTVITTGTGKTNETTVKLKADLNASLSIAMIVQVEVKKTGTPFDGTGIVDGTGCTGLTCLDATATVTGLTDTTPDGLYHWRARTKNTATLEVSNWVNFNAGSTAFIVDVTAPTISYGGANACDDADGSPGTNSATISFTTNETADSGEVEYSTSSTFASGNVTQTDQTNLTSYALNLTNLNSGTTYYWRVKATDLVANSACRSNGVSGITCPAPAPFCSFLTGSVTQPGKTTKFHITGEINPVTNPSVITARFTVLAPEAGPPVPSVKSAYVEVTGLVSGGSNPIDIKVNGGATKSFAVSAASITRFKFIYQIANPNTETELNLNNVTPCSYDDTPLGVPENPPCNTLTVTPQAGMTVNITSAKIVATYGYTP